MKKWILIAALSLVGCDEEKAGDMYTGRPTLTSDEVVALHNVCKSQPNYDTSWVETRTKGEAKGVICRYRDANYVRSVSTTFRIDAEDLKKKLEARKAE